MADTFTFAGHANLARSSVQHEGHVATLSNSFEDQAAQDDEQRDMVGDVAHALSGMMSLSRACASYAKCWRPEMVT